MPRAAGGWAYLGLGICCWALGCKGQGRPPPPGPVRLWAASSASLGLFLPLPKWGTPEPSLCFQTAEFQQDRPWPITEAFWARICGRDENADELTDPWVSSGVPAPRHMDRVGGRVGSFSPVRTSVQDGLPLA